MNIKKFDSINVVPFIDIMLVLLVIVLTTATFISNGLIPVSLPNSNDEKVQIKKKDLIITIKLNGEVYIDKILTSPENLINHLKKYNTKTPIILNCDKDVKFANFVHILNILKNENYENFSILTKNE